MNKNHLFIFSYSLFLVVLLSGFSLNQKKEYFSRSSYDTSAPFIHAKDHRSQNVVSSTGLLSLVTGLENERYFLDSSGRKGYFYIETRVGKYIKDTAHRVPLNISIVIDRSGSMQGVKMGYAKKAAKNIIDQLNPEDYVSIVIYDNSVDSIQPPVAAIDKEAIKKKINGIAPRGSTNLWEGTEMGYYFVDRNYKEGFINRVLLISDGIANTGLTDSNIIRMKVRQFKDDNGITISTFGVGLDYNETLMTDMAETGAGNYYFIDAPEKMTGIFQKELAGLLSVAARDAELKIKIPEGIIIERGYPLRYQQQGGTLTIKLRDLFSEEVKGMLFTFRMDQKTRSGLVFSTSLSYTDVSDGQEKTIQNLNTLAPESKMDNYLAWFNKKVIEQSILFTASENLEKAMALVDRGDMAGARDQLVLANKYLRTYENYVKGSAELTKMDSITALYSLDITKAGNLQADSLKKMQKS
ncbi:MAG TPA: VWA domain-containing protein, partial [Flavisolibacter sp.]